MRELKRRIERLEEAQVPPRVFRLAFCRYQKTGELPNSRRLAQLIEEIAATLEAMDATVPTAPDGEE